ncbi:uncharacterized protein METZ01_LOCUS380179, partial [marine metagenome]
SADQQHSFGESGMGKRYALSKHLQVEKQGFDKSHVGKAYHLVY